jgi:23S rRNA (guanosine2251-2'-O)-methyltransferase
MRKLHHYSREKFAGFAEDKQAKALLQLLCALENNLSDAEYIAVMVPEILECYHWSYPAVQSAFGVLPALAVADSPHEIIKIIVPLIRSSKSSFVGNDPEILRFDGSGRQAETVAPHPLTVVLDNLRSAYNVGSIFRTAECVGAKSILLCGITPAPPHPGLLKTAMGTEQRLSWQQFSSTEQAVDLLKKQGIPVIALETTTHAKPLFAYEVTRPVAMIMGNEALGIEEKILALADEVLYIPVCGWKNSLNVSNAFAVAAYRLSGLSSN